LGDTAVVGAEAVTPARHSNDCQIDVRRWQRDGLLQAGQCFALEWKRGSAVVAAISVRTETDQVVLLYRFPSYDDSRVDLEYAVRLEHTSCHYGGTRAWFLCLTTDWRLDVPNCLPVLPMKACLLRDRARQFNVRQPCICSN
jgi:hypothetical protein